MERATYYAKLPHFSSLIPLAHRMYTCARDMAQRRSSPTLGRLLMLSHREFLVGASLIQRGLPYDAGANMRRAIEIAKLALALKHDPANAHNWLQAEIRKARWDARQQGDNVPRLPTVRYPDIDDDPLFATLKEFFGIASDMFVHFTPEFLGIHGMREDTGENDTIFLTLDYFAPEREVLLYALNLCGLHVRILLLFDECFDNAVTTDSGWKLLKATFDQLGKDLLNALPPREPR